MPPTTVNHIVRQDASDFFKTASRRSVVHSTRGIVASTQPLACQAGIAILNQGGNAADAAVAVAAALNVTEPSMTGIGGDCFCLFYDSKTKKVRALNGSGRSGSQTSLEGMRRDLGLVGREGGRIPSNSVHSITVPGAAAGWVDAVERFGGGNLRLGQILAPAIELAERGYPVAEVSSHYWQRSEELLKGASPNGREMLKNDVSAKGGCRAPKPGEIMKLPGLASTFKALAKEGKKGFYEGRIAQATIEVIHQLGSHLTLEDLKSHAERGSEEPDAMCLTFRGQGVNRNHGGINVWEHPPNGQGIVALMALGILEEMEHIGKINRWKASEHNSAEHLHAVIEALRIAFTDGNWWIADPDSSQFDHRTLIEKPYLRERASLFDPQKASSVIDHGSPAHNHSDTVYFAVTDAEGNGCSFINSNYGGFGTGIIPKDCGFTLQNRGANFVLIDGHPNAYAPSKRPYHTIIPAILTNPSDNSLHSVFGVMAGFMQPQGHVQVLLNMLAFNMSPQAALDAPRICIAAGTPEQGRAADDTIYVEEGIPPEVVHRLASMGHCVKVIGGHERSLFGRGQLIRAHFDEGQLVYSAGSDLRGDGAALPVL